MYCKFCGAELEEGKTLCASCGKETEEKNTGIVVTPGKLALSIGAVVVLLAVLVALIFSGLKDNGPGPGVTEPALETEVTTEPVSEETVPPTAPADTGLDDVTHKGSYTAGEEEARAAMDTVVATMGDIQLTNAQLQVHYWLQIQEFLNSEYGYYASYLGLDYTKPLDTQMCALEEGLTWQQYFLKGALNAWYNYQVMACEAEASGFEVPQEDREYLDTLPEKIQENAAAAGFETVEEYMAYMIGPGADVEDYIYFWELYYRGFGYFSHQYDLLLPTDEEAAAYFEENLEAYAAEGLTKDSRTVNVRHILMLPEGATLDTVFIETFPEEAWEATRVKAQQMLDEWVAGDGTEEGFAALANEHSVDGGSNTNGGLYTDVYQGEMVEAFDAWCFDPARQVGDYGLVKTEYGYHIMYYCGFTQLWLEYARGDLASERSSQMLSDAAAKYTYEVDYAAILLGNAGLFG